MGGHLCRKFTRVSFVRNKSLEIISDIHLGRCHSKFEKKKGVIAYIPVHVLLTRQSHNALNKIEVLFSYKCLSGAAS